ICERNGRAGSGVAAMARGVGRCHGCCVHRRGHRRAPRRLCALGRDARGMADGRFHGVRVAACRGDRAERGAMERIRRLVDLGRERLDRGRLLRQDVAPRSPRHKEIVMTAKIQPCLWYDKNAEEAARFYAATFPNSRIDAVHRSPGDYPSGKKGDILTVEMTILGMPFLLLNGGPAFTFDEAISIQIATEDQQETDRYWSAIVD